jgi:hypothetical protein
VDVSSRTGDLGELALGELALGELALVFSILPKVKRF